MHIRPFEIALIGIFVLAGFAGLVCLSSVCKPDTDPEAQLYGENVSIWGTVDREAMDSFLLDRSYENKALDVVNYKQIDPRKFQNELVNAIAEGRSPDLVILPHTLLVTYRTKLQPISFETFNQRTFRDSYIDGAEIFMRDDGIYGLPFAVDPLVMYWNRDIFSSSGLSLPPKTWELLMSETVPKVTRIDDQLVVSQATVAFGEYSNVTHAKNILATLFMQSGSSIVEERDKSYLVTIGQKVENGLIPGDAALTFYTQFSNPANALYTWNRSMNYDRTEFLNGRLALYFGKGSDRLALDRENSNLNFDIARVPQGSGVTTERVYGDFYAFAIPRASQNIQGAYAVASLFGNEVNAQRLADALNLAPVHRALFGGAVADPLKNVVYQSALIARGWLDPSPKESDDVFRTMVEEVSSGRTRLKNVVMDAVDTLEALFR